MKAAGERAPAPLLAMVHAAQRPADLVSALRSQLMRDNYDYQNTNTDDERAHASQVSRALYSLCLLNALRSGPRLVVDFRRMETTTLMCRELKTTKKTATQ